MKGSGTPYGFFLGVAATSNGSRLYAAAYTYIYASNDSGVTWAKLPNPELTNWQWLGIATSADGTKIAAAPRPGHIFTSNDSGATWYNQTNSSYAIYEGIAASSNGSIIYATSNNLAVQKSNDSGVTWYQTSVPGGGLSVATSSNGSKVVAIGYNGSVSYIYTSNDTGVTWTQRTNAASLNFSNNENWYWVTSSEDGSKLAAAVYIGYIYTSNDSGVTWTKQLNSSKQAWYSVSSSTDGTKLAAVVRGGYIYTSKDSGVTWTKSF